MLKDPRICRFTPFWLDVLREIDVTPHFVMPIRSPLDVARSLAPLYDFSITQALLIWLRNVLDAEADSRRESRSIFSWRDFRADWRGVCGKIAADTRLSWPRMSDRAAREIDRFLSKDLVHHDTDKRSLEAHADVHEWTLGAYDALLELARDPLSNSALTALDEIRGLLNASTRIFGRILVDYEVDLEEARERATSSIRERDALSLARSQDLAELEGRRAALAAELASANENLRATTNALAESERRETEFARALDEASREKEALALSLSRWNGELEGLRSARAGLAAEVEALRAERDEKEAALARSERRSREIERELDEARRAREALDMTLSLAIAELDELRPVHSALASEARSLRDRLDETTSALAESEERATQAERERQEAVNDKRAFAVRLLEAITERDRRIEENAELVAERETRRRELGATASPLRANEAESLRPEFERRGSREGVVDREASRAGGAEDDLRSPRA
jgi:DNA repair exonuclease SbcCD ATPase subunit